MMTAQGLLRGVVASTQAVNLHLLVLAMFLGNKHATAFCLAVFIVVAVVSPVATLRKLLAVAHFYHRAAYYGGIAAFVLGLLLGGGLLAAGASLGDETVIADGYYFLRVTLSFGFVGALANQAVGRALYPDGISEPRGAWISRSPGGLPSAALKDLYRRARR